MLPVLGSSQQHGDCHISEREIGWNFFQDGLQTFRPNQTIRYVRINAIGTDGKQQCYSKYIARQNSPPAVATPDALTINDIKFISISPKPEKILGVALTVRINLENKWNLPFACFAVACKAALAVANIGLIKNFKACTKLSLQSF